MATRGRGDVVMHDQHANMLAGLGRRNLYLSIYNRAKSEVGEVLASGVWRIGIWIGRVPREACTAQTTRYPPTHSGRWQYLQVAPSVSKVMLAAVAIPDSVCTFSCTVSCLCLP